MTTITTLYTKCQVDTKGLGHKGQMLKCHHIVCTLLRGLFDMYCVLYDISKAFDSNSQMDITSLQSILRDLKYTISISESISEMRHGMLI